MTPSVVLIVRPDIDFDTFIGVSHKVLGFNPAAKVDASRLNHSDPERFKSCLALIRHKDAVRNPNLSNFLFYVVQIVADERDLIDIVEAASAMPLVAAETISRGVMMGIIGGTMSQWRDAVVNGASPITEFNIRGFFCRVKALFEAEGIHEWQDYQVKPMKDQTFYLEDKR